MLVQAATVPLRSIASDQSGAHWIGTHILAIRAKVFAVPNPMFEKVALELQPIAACEFLSEVQRYYYIMHACYEN